MIFTIRIDPSGLITPSKSCRLDVARGAPASSSEGFSRFSVSRTVKTPSTGAVISYRPLSGEIPEKDEHSVRQAESLGRPWRWASEVTDEGAQTGGA